MTESHALALRETAEQSLRPIHYLGNKSKIVDEIASTIGDLAGRGAVVCDLFAGSGVVSRRLAREHSIIAADVQEYSRVLTQALLEPRALPDRLVESLFVSAREKSDQLCTGALAALVEYEATALRAAAAQYADDLCCLVEQGPLVNRASDRADAPGLLITLFGDARRRLPQLQGSVMTRYYGGVYYSFAQAAELDGLANAVRALPRQYRDVGLAALLGTASDLVSSVGNQFAQPMKLKRADGSVKTALVAATMRARSRSVLETFSEWLRRYAALTPRPGRHRVYCADFRGVLGTLPHEVAAIYADPPYTRDHYSRFYHVLETLALGDEPGVSKMTSGGDVRASRAVYRLARHQSPFSIKSQAGRAFDDLFAASARLNAPLVVSYSPRSPGTPSRADTRLLTLEQLVDLAGQHCRSVQVHATGRGAHSKFNAARVNAGAGDGETEVLLVAKP